MNAKAVALGLRNTHFSNACGFDALGHYSTAEDLAKLSEIALHHPRFKELVREEREIIMPINEHRAYVLRTTNACSGVSPVCRA
jgi:D-alanyl-D-alanine carboxypeptidase (penicillin-binding protein 5/6)